MNSATSTPYSLAETKLRLILQPGPGMSRWLDLFPEPIHVLLYESISGPLKALPFKYKYQFVLDCIGLVYRHVHYGVGRQWYEDPDDSVFYVLHSHIDELICEYLQRYGGDTRAQQRRHSVAIYDADDVLGSVEDFELPAVAMKQAPTFRPIFSILTREEKKAKRDAAKLRRYERWQKRQLAEREVSQFSTPVSEAVSGSGGFEPQHESGAAVKRGIVSTFAGVIRRVKRWFRFGKILCEREARLQSGKAEAKAKRAEREAHQRDTAKEKVKAVWKARDKHERQMELKYRREKRQELEDLCLRGLISRPRNSRSPPRSVSLQSGFSTGVQVGAGVALGIAFTTLAYKLTESLVKVDKAVDGLAGLVQQLRDFAAQLKRQLGDVLWVTPLVLVVFYYMNTTTTLTSGMQALITTALHSVVGAVVWKSVAEFFRPRRATFQSGGGVDVGPMLSHLPKLFTTVLAASVFKGKPLDVAILSAFSTKLSTLNRSAEGWESFLKWFLSAFELAINFFRERFGAERLQLFRDQHQPMKEWAAKVSDVLAVSEKGGTFCPEQLDTLINLIAEGHVFRDLYRATSLSRVVEEVLIRAVTTLSSVAGAINSRDNFRVEPSMLVLHGRPGIGKSMMAMHLCAAVLLQSGLVNPADGADAVLRNIWQKGNSEFWNGYCRQLCLVMDDLFQMKVDPKDKENDYMTILRAASSWSFPLNFADLASKGKIYFGSKFIFGTTNLNSVASEAGQAMHDVGAVIRRINHPYTLCVHDAYMLPNGMLDYAKFVVEWEEARKTATVPLDAYPWHIWYVKKHDFLSASDSPMAMPLRDLIVEVSAELRARNATHGDAKEHLVSFVEGFKAKLQSGDPSCSFTPPKPKPKPAVKEVSALKRPGMPFRLDHSWSNWMGWSFWKQTEKIQMLKHIDCEIAAQEDSDYLASLAWWQASGVILGRMAMLGGGIYVAIVALSATIRFVLDGLWKLLTNLFGWKQKKTQSNRKATVPERTFNPPVVLLSEKQMQSSSNPTRDNIYANTYKIHIDLKSGQRIIVGQTVFVESDLAVQPAHFTTEFIARMARGEVDDDTDVVLRSAVNKSHTFSYKMREYLLFPRHTFANTEAQFVRYRCANAHRNIRKNFIVESDIPSVKARPVCLDVCDVDKDGRWTTENTRTVFSSESTAYRASGYADGCSLGPCFYYKMPTRSGDCGAPLSLVDNRLFGGRTCMGIHVAGEVGFGAGYSTIVTQDMIRVASEKLGVIKDEFVEDLEPVVNTLQSSNVLPFKEEGSFLPLYKVQKGVNIAPKSAFYKTFLHGRMGEYADTPAPMGPVWRDGILVYPMDNAVKPYSSPLVHYSQPWLKQAMHVAMRPFVEKTEDSDRSVYTFEQAVLGIPTRKFRSIPRATSAGYPFVLTIKGKGKKAFFGDGTDYDLTREEAQELKERVLHIEAKAKQGVRLAVVYMDFLKDELRSPAKVEAVATRLISSAPLDYTTVWRMYFGAISSEIMHFNLHVGMAPGICSYTDTGELVEFLKSKGTKCFDGDFKGFDASEQPTVHKLCLDFVNEWYDDGPVNSKVREVLWQDLVHSRHIGGRGFDQSHIYQWNKSLPSGHPFTTIVNSMYSLFCLVAAYISITGDKTGFWDFVAAVTYGDDNVVNVSDAKVAVYNQVTVSKALAKEFGLVYTSGDKTGEMVPYKGLESLTFLKRSFRLEGNRWLCPLELNSFLFTHYWGCNRKYEATILVDVLENALQELSMHPVDAWDKYAPALKGCLSYLGKTTRLVFTRQSYQDLVITRVDNWY